MLVRQPDRCHSGDCGCTVCASLPSPSPASLWSQYLGWTGSMRRLWARPCFAQVPSPVAAAVRSWVPIATARRPWWRSRATWQGAGLGSEGLW